MAKNDTYTPGRDTFLIMVSGLAGAYLSRALSMFSFWGFILYALISMVGLYVVLAFIMPSLGKKKNKRKVA